MKLRKLDPNIIRVDDTVKIINPVFVTRCGYPLGIIDMEKEIEEQFGKAIDDLMNKVGGIVIDDLRDKFGRNDSPVIRKRNKIFHNIIREMAYIRLQAKNYGGKERTLHTKIIEELKGKETRVVRIQIVKTGIYESATGGFDYYGESEYEPAYLINPKTHKILTLGLCNNSEGEWVHEWIRDFANNLKIEATNVEKIRGLMETPTEYEYRIRQLEKQNGQSSA